jgi:hypothetical protein
MTTMKFRVQISTVIFLLSVATALAQPTVPTSAIDPTTGLPVRNRAGRSQPQTMPDIDPQTGLPIAPAPTQPEWKDPEWKDPDVRLADVNFEGLPIGEIAKFIRDRFKGQFDIILPEPTGEGINHLTERLVPPTDWRNETTLNLKLKDVTASELFNAMNLTFENDKTPLQWELKVFGHRQIALLRVLLDPAPADAPTPPQKQLQRIYFIGDLIGDEKNGGMTMDQIITTITDIWKMTDNTNGRIQFHNEAQLLVVSGTPAQIQFVDQTLNALHEKVALARRTLPKSAELKTKADESKK